MTVPRSGTGVSMLLSYKLYVLALPDCAGPHFEHWLWDVPLLCGAAWPLCILLPCITYMLAKGPLVHHTPAHPAPAHPGPSAMRHPIITGSVHALPLLLHAVRASVGSYTAISVSCLAAGLCALASLPSPLCPASSRQFWVGSACYRWVVAPVRCRYA